MQSMPAPGPRYWAALCLASIAGCNIGDALAEDAGLGHWRGLPILALAFAATLFAERRSRAPDERCYWLAILIVRAAATNLADLLVHDARIPYLGAFALLAAILVTVTLLTGRRTPGGAMPAADALFWTGMFAAGTFGTAAGDDLATQPGLGLAAASAASSLAVVAALGLRAVPALRGAATFWTAVVLIRTAGTNLGDLSARHITLGPSTIVTGAALFAFISLWRGSPPHRRTRRSMSDPEDGRRRSG
jgi:uncharacterized membrane-anchored protein